jgi:hypothetical protein
VTLVALSKAKIFSTPAKSTAIRFPKDSSGSRIRVSIFISHIFINQNHPVPTSKFL